MIGKTFGHYEILEKIGAGGMGEVYRARDAKLGREVAIKVLPADLTGDADRLSRFEQEARAVGALNHPNLVTLFELGTHEGSPFMVMELIEGETLREKLGQTPGSSSAGSVSSGSGATGASAALPGSALPTRKALEIAIQIARGLGTAHGSGIMHRDLKPENILVTPDGRVKILDFGLAKLTGPADESLTLAMTRAADTRPGTVMGTVGYMSPEQVRGQSVDHRSDIFALGVILYEMLAGRRAFAAETSVETMNAILKEDPPSLAQDTLRLSPAVDRVVRRCLEKEPGQRFQSCHDLAYALEALQDVSGSAPAQALDAEPSAADRSPLLWVASALVLAVAGFFLGRVSEGEPETTGSPSSAEMPAARLQPLTFEDGEETQPAISPDGKSFVYVSDRDGDLDIYRQRVGGENAINLTADSSGDESQPAFSSDGEWIAYATESDDDPQPDGIFIMGATGESRRRLTDFGAGPAWSPDGKTIAFSTASVFSATGRSTRAELWTVDVASGEITKLLDPDAVQPHWSPNGKWIAYWGLPPGTGKRVLYVVDAAGGEPRALTDDDFFNWTPRWSRDGEFLYFSSTRGGTSDIWRLPMDPATGSATGDPLPVTVSAQESREPSISRDGTRIVYTAGGQTVSVLRFSFDAESLQLDTTPEILLRTARDFWEVDPSPDGRWIVLKGFDSQEDLFLAEADGSSLRRLTNDVHKDRGPEWSQDSRSIYFFSDRSGRYEIWSIRPDGSGLTQVTKTAGASINMPVVSPDGSVVLAGTSSGGSFLIDPSLPFPLSDEQLDQLPALETGGTFRGYVWSSDSNSLLGMESGTGIPYRYDRDTQSYRTTAVSVGFNTLWVGETVVVGGDVLRALDVDTGEEIKSWDVGAALDLHLRGISLSGDGRWIYSIGRRGESDIWMLEQ